MNNTRIVAAAVSDYPRLLAIWESAVKATHDFLSEADFEYFKTKMTSYFKQVSLFACATSAGELAEFVGVADRRIEMLFVHNAFRGQGVGKQLLSFAIHRLNACQLDVNEQNLQAVGFYLHMGFRITGRASHDGAGKPYPVLHLRNMTEAECPASPLR